MQYHDRKRESKEKEVHRASNKEYENEIRVNGVLKEMYNDNADQISDKSISKASHMFQIGYMKPHTKFKIRNARSRMPC